MKKIIVLIFLLMFLLSGCLIPFDPILRYSGEYVALDAAAIYSIPGVESSIGDEILVLEQDAYGRTLFAICLDRDIVVFPHKSYDWKVLAIVIVQDQDDSSVYFYGEQNYCMLKIEGEAELTKELVNVSFDEEMVSQLKTENDWDVPRENAYRVSVKAPIQVEKNKLMNSQQKSLLREYIGSNIKTQFLRQDREGRELYFVLEIQNQEPVIYKWYAAMFDADGTLLGGEDGIVQLYSLTTIHEDISHFMQLHGWVDITE